MDVRTKNARLASGRLGGAGRRRRRCRGVDLTTQPSTDPLGSSLTPVLERPSQLTLIEVRISSGCLCSRDVGVDRTVVLKILILGGLEKVTAPET